MVYTMKSEDKAGKKLHLAVFLLSFIYLSSVFG